ncbi:hypothetical protein HMPREF9333_02013 [Johnsonella ignava ATCC 51276]|jgi:hypothetical protein|uniref:DUF4446 domain-containing protein n=1 Tax=Johnsonella ignava ATCC 51276 TaxID=679200 RepID=G5GKC2_9FIRM|nr:DUF4446 family protein [Johnsonella ignava]EHI54812.1 hypothetical protein HMPREF9333_02013 [Johnsonella ignava ATCC 51276]
MQIDNSIIIYILIGFDILIIIGLLIFYIRCKKLFQSYDYFMRGRDAENLEDIIRGLASDLRNLRQEDRENKEAIRILNKNQRASYQKLGIVRYNAFEKMGGDLSFACALLDYTNSGLIINSVHSREGCYVYVKIVDRGQTEVLLGKEEKEALEQALGYKERV